MVLATSHQPSTRPSTTSRLHPQPADQSLHRTRGGSLPRCAMTLILAWVESLQQTRRGTPSDQRTQDRGMAARLAQPTQHALDLSPYAGAGRPGRNPRVPALPAREPGLLQPQLTRFCGPVLRGRMSLCRRSSRPRSSVMSSGSPAGARATPRSLPTSTSRSSRCAAGFVRIWASWCPKAGLQADGAVLVFVVVVGGREPTRPASAIGRAEGCCVPPPAAGGGHRPDRYGIERSTEPRRGAPRAACSP